MPAAKEIENNGLALGELVKLCQKKIDELTLHLIEKDKELRGIAVKQKDMEILLKKLVKNKMKKIKLSLFGLMLSASAFAQVYTDPVNGNVGIGTTSPVAKLDIFTTDNTAAASLFSLRSNFHVAGNYGMIRFGDYTQTTQYQKGAIIYESVWGSARGKFHIAMENTDGPGSVTLADVRFTVQSDGNVGIGTTTPREKLSVNGNIRAKEIKVEATNWPDYVFEEDYHVGKLEELESYIKANKHLPEIPAAKEIREHGIELGEMNKLLLKKIEELTLNMIDQQKQINELKKTVKQ